MENDVTRQLAELMYSAAFGLIPGLAFDLFRTIRAVAGKSRLVVNIADLLYWLGVSALLFLFGITVVTEGFRWHILLGISAGLFVYFMLISRPAKSAFFISARSCFRAGRKLMTFFGIYTKKQL